MDLFKDKSKHKWVKAVKLFECNSSEQLEDEVNNFGKKNEIVNVDVSKSSVRVNLGLGLVDVPVYSATLVYRRDLTQENIDDSVGELLVSSIQAEVDNIRKRIGFPLFDASRGTQESERDYTRRRYRELMESEDFRKKIESIIEAEEGNDGHKSKS